MTALSAIGRIGVVGLIRAYQWMVSPLLPPCCRYTPSCSHYAAEAVMRHGPLQGSWYAMRRILRCHPWGGAGYDPVPGLPAARGAKPRHHA